jgi:hypothetical protein
MSDGGVCAGVVGGNRAGRLLLAGGGAAGDDSGTCESAEDELPMTVKATPPSASTSTTPPATRWLGWQCAFLLGARRMRPAPSSGTLSSLIAAPEVIWLCVGVSDCDCRPLNGSGRTWHEDVDCCGDVTRLGDGGENGLSSAGSSSCSSARSNVSSGVGEACALMRAAPRR